MSALKLWCEVFTLIVIRSSAFHTFHTCAKPPYNNLLPYKPLAFRDLIRVEKPTRFCFFLN